MDWTKKDSQNSAIKYALQFILSFVEPLCNTQWRQKPVLRILLISWTILATYIIAFYNLELRSFLIGQEFHDIASDVHHINVFKSIILKLGFDKESNIHNEIIIMKTQL